MIWTFIIHVQLLDLKFLWGWLCQNPHAIAWRNISGILILLQICSSEWNLGSCSYLVTMLSRLLDSISFRITCRTFPVSCAWDWENCNVLYFFVAVLLWIHRETPKWPSRNWPAHSSLPSTLRGRTESCAC